jgi:signal transduction histidine kinase
VRAADDNGDLVLEVRDEGPGIEAQHQDRIFERFYRIDKARNRAVGGSGLGLSIVKHIAHVHQGSVSLRSAPGQGATFLLRLPLRPPA